MFCYLQLPNVGEDQWLTGLRKLATQKFVAAAAPMYWGAKVNEPQYCLFTAATIYISLLFEVKIAFMQEC